MRLQIIKEPDTISTIADLLDDTFEWCCAWCVQIKKGCNGRGNLSRLPSTKPPQKAIQRFRKPVEGASDEVWTVKRLLQFDPERLDENTGKRGYYQVHWEPGDYPSDQEYTWEPSSTIDTESKKCSYLGKRVRKEFSFADPGTNQWVFDGFVKEYLPADDDNEEGWRVEWEAPRQGGETDCEDVAKADLKVLVKYYTKHHKIVAENVWHINCGLSD